MIKLNLAIIGASGVVGKSILEILETLPHINITNLYLLSSIRSAGTVINFKNKEYVIQELTEDFFVNTNVNYAIFCASSNISSHFAPIAVKNNCIVIDNSSVWRMDKDVPLIVPEVNKDKIHSHKGIIANPNCATIQGVLALKPLQDAFGLKRVIYSTYQAVSGAGQGAIYDLLDGLELNTPPKNFVHPIAFNLIPQIDVFDKETGYTGEEQKIIDETKKILSLNDLKITTTAVRVPIINGHSISANIEFLRDFSIEEVVQTFANAEGIAIVDDIEHNIYPMPLMASGKDHAYIGRIRRDFSVDFGINIFISADNLRKGAALNALQILELLI